MGNSLKHNKISEYKVVETIPESLNLKSNNLTTYECFKRLIQLAEKEIYIVSYCCNLGSNLKGTDVLNRLIDAAERVLVTIFVDENAPHKDYDKIIASKIKYVKVNIGDYSGESVGNLLGNFWVVDKRHFYIGSASLVGSSITTIKNVGVYSENNELSKDLYRRCIDYSLISKKKCFLFVKLLTKYHIIKHYGGMFFSDSPECLLGSHRTYDLDCVLNFINSSAVSIDLEVVSLMPTLRFEDSVEYWPYIKDALIKATLERGVRLRLLLGYWEKTDPVSKACVKSIKELGVNSVEIYTKIFKFPVNSKMDDINNTKIMIVDNKYSHVTSADLSGSHFTYNAFVSFNCMSQSFTKKLLDVFERDWTSNYATEL